MTMVRDPHKGVPASGPDRADDDTAPVDRFREQVVPELPVMLRVARRMTSNGADAEDLVQETLIRAHRGIHTFDGRHPRAWLLTIQRNTWVDMNRRKRLLIADDPEGLRQRAAEGADGRTGPEEQVLDRMLEGPLVDALHSLSAVHREVVLLVDADGLTYAEAAGVLDIPVGTVMSRLHRARRALRQRLDRAGFGAEGMRT
jgi:RNA polymerase sigma-70 factor, ECF subfamily